MTITLHHIPMTRSLRPLWLMEELGVEFTLVKEGNHIGELDKKAYRHKNPMAKMPVMYDGDIRLMESLACVEYVAQKYAGDHLMRRPDEDDYSRYLQLFHFGEAGLGGYISLLLGHTVLLPEEHRDPKLAKWAQREINFGLDYLETEVDGDYLLGDFSLCDISVAYILFLLKISRNAEGMGPNITEYFNRVKNRDAWIRACKH